MTGKRLLNRFCCCLRRCDCCRIIWGLWAILLRMRNDHQIVRWKKTLLVFVGGIFLPIVAFGFAMACIPLDIQPYVYGYCCLGFLLSTCCFCFCGCFEIYVFFLCFTLMNIVLSLSVRLMGVLNHTTLGILIFLPGLPIIFEASRCQQIFWLIVYLFLNFVTIVVDLSFMTDRKPIPSIYNREIEIFNAICNIFIPGAIIIFSVFFSNILHKNDEKRVEKISRNIVNLDLDTKYVRKLMKKKNCAPIESNLQTIVQNIIEYRKYLPASLLDFGDDKEEKQDEDFTKNDDDDDEGSTGSLSSTNSMENEEKLEVIDPVVVVRDESSVGSMRSRTSSSGSSSSSGVGKRRHPHMRLKLSQRMRRLHRKNKNLIIRSRRRITSRNNMNTKTDLGLMRRKVVFIILQFSNLNDNKMFIDHGSFDPEAISYLYGKLFDFATFHCTKNELRGVVKGIEFDHSLIVTFNSIRRVVLCELNAMRCAKRMFEAKSSFEKMCLKHLLLKLGYPEHDDEVTKSVRLSISVFSDPSCVQGNVGGSDVKNFVLFGMDHLKEKVATRNKFFSHRELVVDKFIKDHVKFHFNIRHSGKVAGCGVEDIVQFMMDREDRKAKDLFYFDRELEHFYTVVMIDEEGEGDEDLEEFRTRSKSQEWNYVLGSSVLDRTKEMDCNRLRTVFFESLFSCSSETKSHPADFLREGKEQGMFSGSEKRQELYKELENIIEKLFPKRKRKKKNKEEDEK